MNKKRFFTCAYCKKPYPQFNFVTIKKGNCVCKFCHTFGERLIPKKYNQVDGILYLRSILEMLRE